jgi:hypothetical protein
MCNMLKERWLGGQFSAGRLKTLSPRLGWQALHPVSLSMRHSDELPCGARLLMRRADWVVGTEIGGLSGGHSVFLLRMH